MNDFEVLKERVEKLERELADFRSNRLYKLSVRETEELRNYIFDRTAATLASGASVKYVIMTINGQRKAVPTYNKFTPIA